MLELYATGQLSAAEKSEVERLARQYPEIQAELGAITEALDRYAALHAVPPPGDLKQKVLAGIKAAQQPPATRSDGQRSGAAAKVVPLVPAGQRSAGEAFRWLVAAAVTLLVISNGLSYYFYRNWQRSEAHLAQAMASQQQYADNVRRVQQQLNQKEIALSVLGDPATRKVELKGVAKSPDSRVMVYWHQSSQKVYLAVNNLPVPPAGRQYQLWALVDGNPVDAGLLDASPGFAALQQMKAIGQAQAFAITLETEGGSKAPTLDQMYVMGAI